MTHHGVRPLSYTEVKAKQINVMYSLVHLHNMWMIMMHDSRTIMGFTSITNVVYDLILRTRITDVVDDLSIYHMLIIFSFILPYKL